MAKAPIQNFLCPVPECDRSFSSAQSLHNHVFGHRSCDEAIPASYYELYRRFDCQFCRKSFSRSRVHHCSFSGSVTSQPISKSRLDSLDPLPTPVSAQSARPPIPGFEDILSLNLPLCRHILKSCRDLFSEALAKLCNRTTRSPQILKGFNSSSCFLGQLCVLPQGWKA